MCVKATAASGHGERRLSCPLFPSPTAHPLPHEGLRLKDLPVHMVLVKAEGFSVVQRPGTPENSMEGQVSAPELLLQGRRQQTSDTFL